MTTNQYKINYSADQSQQSHPPYIQQEFSGAVFNTQNPNMAQPQPNTVIYIQPGNASNQDAVGRCCCCETRSCLRFMIIVYNYI